jgi:serine protease AprX
MILLNQPYKQGVVLTVTLLFFMATGHLNGQGDYYYRVYLKDKGENKPENMTLSDLLSPRAVERRKKTGITQPDYRDVPVWTNYLKKISEKGFNLHCTSKWMNTALFRSHTAADINVLLSMPFVSDALIVKRPGSKSNYINKLKFTEEVDNLPPFDRPVTMVNGSPLHNSGFDGKNVLIAVLDGGFLYGDQISSLNHLRNRKGIKYVYDFVNNSESVYTSSTHGTAVMSILAGKLAGVIEGTAPGADYFLFRTEDTGSEFPCEEDFWAAGAEFADSSGADIISSSLGYSEFDDPALNYKYSDADGNTAFITKVADIAASKGILVVNSAGNERNKPWQRIIFPSDGDSVLASAAVDGNNYISVFSSAGPSADGRIKPDVSTMGVSVPIQTSTSLVTRGNGTSFSCPVLSGMAACLMQAVPEAGNYDVIKAIHASSSKYYTPDSLYGYGIPDMVTALVELQNKFLRTAGDMPLASPNPTKGDFELVFSQPPGQYTIEIFSITGTLIYKRNFSEYVGRRIIINELQYRSQGIYFIRSITDSGVYVQKVIKLND